tara:strand:- start:6 stop:518 length:513 start_codon:yes stop_codon:yes gene_type:complete
MKKVFFIAMITIGAFTTVNAQSTQFSVTGGYVNGNAKVEGFGESESDAQGGLYLGFAANFSLAEKSSIYTELAYMNIDDTNFIQLPVLFKYEFADNLSFLVGPQFTYTAEESFEELSNFSLGLSVGLGYDFTEKLYGLARYTQQLNNYYTGSFDIDATINFFNVGIGYRF